MLSAVIVFEIKYIAPPPPNISLSLIALLGGELMFIKFFFLVGKGEL